MNAEWRREQRWKDNKHVLCEEGNNGGNIRWMREIERVKERRVIVCSTTLFVFLLLFGLIKQVKKT